MSTSTKDRTHGSATTDRPAKVSPKQVSAEQRRIADLMTDKTDISELQSKVEKIIELTNATRDEAVVALHDCDNELDRAIDMILEGESVNVTEWRSTGKKRKPKVVASSTSQADKEDKSNANESTNVGDKKVSSNRGRGGPRLQRGAGGSGKSSNWKPKEEKSDMTNENNENTAPEISINNKNLPPRRGDSRRGRGRGSTRGNFSNRGTGGGRGARLFQNKGYRNTNNTGNNNNDGFPNSIDTWTNSTADQASTITNNECTTMHVGNWSDFATNEDWSEEDWDSSLMETKVFTPSTKPSNDKEDTGDLPANNVTNTTNQGLNFGSLLGKQSNESSNQPSQQSMSSILGSNVPRSSATNSSAGAALLQQLQQQAVSSQSSSQINKFSLSQYTKQATENIKSLVGIPTTTYNSNNANIMNADSLDNQVSDLSQRQLEGQGDNQSGSLSSSKPPRLTVKRSSKIPESAVEMPSNDSISALNVQFGAMPFDLGPEANNAFHDVVNHVKSKSNQVKAAGSTSVPGSSSLGSSALLNQTVSDNAFRAANNANNQSAGSSAAKSLANTASDLVLQNSVLGHQTISAEIGLDRNKSASAASYGTKVLEGNHNKNIYQSGATTQVQPSKTSTSDISSYKNTSYPQADSNSAYGSNVNYGASTTSTPYYSANQTQGAYSSATNYSSFQPVSTATSHANVAGQKTGGIKDLDSSASNTQHKHNYDLTQGVPNVVPGGLVSNSTVTTNVLKNSLTATGKGIPSVPPGVTPLMGTQYIMSQAGLSAFYPFYDVSSIPTAPHARDHNFAYSANTDLKYSRADNDGSNVVSTQSPVSQTHNQAIFGQIPHAAYSFFYTPGVNMMPQSLYGPAAPIFPVTPATNTGSTGSAFPKGTTGYGSHSYASAGYDSLAAVPPPSDYVKTNYGPSAGQQQVKGINSSNANDLSGSNAMYGKSHPQLNKGYDKPNSFQTATPPPFNMTGAPQANTLGSGYAPQPPNQYIPMLPQTQPSMLHHNLQGDVSQSGGAGVGGQRSMYQPQKGSAPNNKSYWNPI
ncbi:ubiquitin-associated protein 2 [Tetranychus urticae]|nr:ubiquitin-associated protein 2 [Tetranychus urticae]XP_015788122.1 ubiquitin-associated protein 2 [Tetranychus urticae]